MISEMRQLLDRKTLARISYNERRHAHRVEALSGQQHEPHKIAERVGEP
jgi:hypothetical protein